MTKIRTFIVVGVACWLSCTDALATFLRDYEGTLGNQRIQMVLQTPDTALPPADTPIEKVHYFYVKHFQDIPLKIIERKGRHLTLEEDDSSGKKRATLYLEFPTYDALHFHSPIEAVAKTIPADEIMGTWESADGKQNLPVKLHGTDAVGAENGNRCDVDAMKLKHLEDRIASFRRAFLSGDNALLRRDFKYSMPRNSQRYRQEVADTAPHDLFCRDVGFLFASFWFGYDGNLINPPK